LTEPTAPRPPESLTAAWLSRALRGSGVLQRENVEAFRPELIGDFSNRLWRLHLVCSSTAGTDGEATPTSVVLKHPRPDRPDDDRLELAAEIRFYRELAADLPIETPRVFFADAERCWLGLEDLTELEPIDFVRGATDEHARLAIDALASLHASRASRVRELEWIPSFSDLAYRDLLEREFEVSWPERRGLLEEIAPAFVPLGDRLGGNVSRALAPLGAPETLLHGDAHFENLALARGDNGVASVRSHDWAAARRGSPAFDAAVFITMSFPTERRRLVERSLVTRHEEALRAGGVEFDDAWHAYRVGVLAWAVRMVQFSRHAADSPGLRLVTQRTAAAAVDHEVDRLLPQ
jgi:hypothetical protein